MTEAPRGTKDILPNEVGSWRKAENVMREVCARFGYREIRTPIFEHTELFHRSIGEATDVVEKEMYTFTDRGERSITLRPENTASVVRAYVEHKLYAEGGLTKLYYLGPMFRYDRPQAGRMRQFHQFGVEALGADSPALDAEVIILAVSVLRHLGLTELKLKLNSVGCPHCRPQHRAQLQEYFRPYVAKLCKDCQGRLERNPLRILDCKSPDCKAIAQGAPRLTDALCPECREHLHKVEELLTAAGIAYELDSNLVRGLDYYTKTAFEIQYTPLGAQSAVAGGGRYDGLTEEIGGPAGPGIGFAMGIERVLLAMTKQNLLTQEAPSLDVYLIATSDLGRTAAFKLAAELREVGLKCEIDFLAKSMKGQMKSANKLGAKFVLICGDEELSRSAVTLRDMTSKEQREIALSEVKNILVQ